MVKPEGFRFLAMDYDIQWDQKAAGHCDVLGSSLITHNSVIVDPAINEQRQRVVLLHELVHLTTAEVFSNASLPSEDQVTAIAAGLFQILEDNPVLTQYLFPRGS